VGYGGEIYRNPKLVDLEKYNAALPEKYQQNEGIINSTHNTYLDVTVRMGMVGLAFYLFILLTAAWMLWDIFRRQKEEFFRSWSICLFACLASIMIINFFADGLYGAQGIILYIILAMIGILWNLARQGRIVPD